MRRPTQTNIKTSEAPVNGKRSRTALRIAFVLLVCGTVLCISYACYQYLYLDQVAQTAADTPDPEALENAPEANGGSLPDNPIDFAALKDQNGDIYAWIYIPNTSINLPILQHPNEDNYYLTHNASGETAIEGAIYTQLVNSTDFSDPVTLIYGHNSANNAMFSTLHYFENTDFYNANTEFYIYTPGHILTYRIVSAYQYDDRHIMNSFDFTDPSVVKTYFEYVCNPDSLVVNSTEGVSLDPETDKIVQLSTCAGSTLPNRRYLVTGVLTNDQETN